MRNLNLTATPRIADVGCYKRPIAAFTNKILPEALFFGVDEDLEAVEWLNSNNLNGGNFADYLAQEPFDLSFLLEVYEHINPQDSRKFLDTIFKRTTSAAFLTMPNFEGWDAAGVEQLAIRDSFKEMRYVPDHLKAFDGRSKDPHTHKQVVTEERLSDDIASVLPNGWEYRVFFAWPWSIKDRARGSVFDHSFKLFAVVWNPASFSGDLVPLLEANLSPMDAGSETAELSEAIRGRDSAQTERAALNLELKKTQAELEQTQAELSCVLRYPWKHVRSFISRGRDPKRKN
ncbi:hypothetical protein [Ruegeria atlantica]|uniref:hypothetical protein n=1 Tax=Ruegeria atlantica TaxID=81569 RepID=UPI0024957F6E|nr:hypothetical protein [Ruegeria atlantica]